MQNIETAVERIAAPILQELGYELIDVEYERKKGAPSELVVYIDKEGGVTLDDCERASRALDEPIEKEDPISDPYVLCLSSPGLDRPLKKERDFERAIGKKVDVRLFAKLEGQKELTGELISFDAEEILIKTKKGLVALPRNKVALIRLHIDF